MTKWTYEQQLAINNREKNILVSASAGSGKTAVLVERIIEKVVNEYMDIDKILVVTFTNSAAQELKEKILNAIYKALESEKDIKKRNHLKEQLVLINRASITTIDAFCYRLVKENFSILELDPNIRICEAEQSILIKTRILEDMLEEEYASSSEDKSVFGLYNILELFSGKDDNLLEYILKVYNYIMSFPKPFKWLDEQIEKYNIDENIDLIDTEFGNDIYTDTISELRYAISRCMDVSKMIEQKDEFIPFFNLFDTDYTNITNCINNSKTWDSLYDNLNNITFSNFPRNKVTDTELKDEIKDIRNKEIKEIVQKCKKQIYAKSREIIHDNSIAYNYMRYLYDFLYKFDENLKKEKKELAIAEFNDIMHYALDLVIDENGKETEIAKELKNKFDEIYTDEYQDTSYVQEALLNAIAKENNRFMVGDIKQSIYSFREARPDIFNEKYMTFKKEEIEENNESKEDKTKEEVEKNEEKEDKNVKIILAKNFRSREEVIKSINYIFEKIMSMKNGECDYTDDETLKCGNTSYPIDENNVERYKTEVNIINLKKEEETTAFIDNINNVSNINNTNSINSNNINTDSNSNTSTDSDDSYELDEDLSKTQIEAKCIAYKIEEIIKNGYVTGKDGTLRKATYKDIVILSRSIANKGEIYEEALKKENIPVFTDSTESIFEGDEVKLILSFLRILDNPYQDVYVIGVMYSIIGNFTLDEIARIRIYNSKDYVYDTLIQISKDEEFKNNYTKLYDKVIKFIKFINEYTRYSKIYTISELLIMLYKDTNIYYQFALEENGRSKRANLDYLIELANNFLTQVGNTLNSYIKYVDGLKDKTDSSGNAKIIGENEDVVRIMTIHKSKGLEFPIVILADTAKGYNLRDIHSGKIEMHHKYGIGIDIVNEELGVTYPSVIKEAIKSVKEKEEKSEELRLLYVALTRAKEKLYIFATTKDFDAEYEKQSITMLNGKFNEMMIASCSSYYKNILPVLKYQEEIEDGEKPIKIVRIDVNDNTTDDRLKEMLGAKEEEKEKLSISDKIERISSENNIKPNVKIYNEIREKLDVKYRYEKDAKSPARVSVSALKLQEMEKIDELENTNNSVVNIIKEENEEYIDDEKTKREKVNTKKYNLPSSISNNKVYTAVRKGILIHFVLQNLDFSINTKSELISYIDNLVINNTISSEDRKYISVNRIYNFLNSNIGKQLKNAKKIYREYEFVLDDKDISNSLIQGVIDLFFETEDKKTILVDFKTDKLDEDIEFIKRYKKQLDIYKEAINILTEYNVDSTYIYSFNLNREIKLED